MVLSSREEDFKLKVTVTYKERTIGDILCEVYLPERLTDPVEVILRPTKEQSNQLGYPFKFSVYGEIRGSANERRGIIKADRVYYKQDSTRYWQQELSETVLIGEPVDLRIVEFIKEDANNYKEQSPMRGTFWLTPSIMLKPVKAFSRSYTGKVTVEEILNYEFTLCSGLSLRFDDHYRYIDRENGDNISFSELVAEFELSPSNTHVDISFEPVDDFLMLTSFAARQRCICLGWELYNSSAITRFFRRDIAIPPEKKDHSFNDTLVDIQDLQDFMNVAYHSFIQAEPKESIRQAIYRTLGQEDRSVESNYLTLFSALETLVLFYQQNSGTEFILASDEWNSFKKDLKNFIKNHPQFSQYRESRKLLYEKLSELKRISFATAFERFCSHYDIDLHDLWPVRDHKDGVSLSNIRHRLIHGDPLIPSQLGALIRANWHLKWTVERSILSVLGWSVLQSKVSRDFLSKNMAPYRNWQEDRMVLTQYN